MGVKRPMDEEFQESSYKQAKHLDSDDKRTSFPEAFSSKEVIHTAYYQGEAAYNFGKCRLLKELGYDDLRASLSLGDMELETSAPLSWVTNSSSEEDAGSGEPYYLSLFPEYFELNFPRRTVNQIEDAYSSLMNCSARKQIPIGPNHQADIPPWDPNAIENDPLSPNNFIDEDNERMVGTCIISTSFSSNSSYGNVKIGQGRRHCGCWDGGSVQCVRQHVKEAREMLRELIGDEKFSDLGFYDMGEEVSSKWTEEEERVFHEVIYSNPVSLGKNFWKQLLLVFPSRTKRDLVSYYFNVFILQRRAVQNRSNFLEIDSDDDEWQGHDGRFYGVVGEDEDSVVESFGDQDVQSWSKDDIPYDDEDDDSDDGNDDGHIGGKGDTGASGEDAHVNDDLGSQSLKPHIDELHNDLCSDHLLSMVNPSDIRENQNVQEDSITSFESELYMGAIGVSFGVTPNARQITLWDDFSGCLAGESNGSSDGLDSGFLLEASDTKVWDESCSTLLPKGVDLLPTCNMIEEIFGPCTSKSN